jgi:hypothetical protein
MKNVTIFTMVIKVTSVPMVTFVVMGYLGNHGCYAPLVATEK